MMAALEPGWVRRLISRRRIRRLRRLWAADFAETVAWMCA